MKITPVDRAAQTTIKAKTVQNAKNPTQGYKWWLTKDKAQRNQEMLSTAAFLKEMQQQRIRHATTYARLYGNIPLSSYGGSTTNKMPSSMNLPIDRPTMNVIQSCADTLISRITQSKPRPVFLTDNGDYKERNLAKKLNNFIQGEIYQTKAYRLGEIMLRDAAVLGTGCLKIFELENKVKLERVLLTELLVDPSEARDGEPRQLYQLKLVDRDVLADLFPKFKSEIALAEQAFYDNSGESSRTVADQVMVIEAWHLPSGEDADDGMHMIACTSGTILDEPWDEDKFPFVFLHYSPRLVGFWGQGLSEQLMGSQLEINKLLMTMSQAINLVGVPRIFVEEGSKVSTPTINNNIGAIVKYSGVKPIYEVAPCIPQEVYAQLERIIQRAYQQAGISQLAANAQKPAGLSSGTALREYDDLQSDRFASLVKRYDNVFVDLAYQIIDKAKKIAEREGSYTTVYPGKKGRMEIDLPKVKLLDNPYIIQCFDSSSLPRDPAGRMQKIVEMMQSGLIDPQEGRRLLDYPDLEQVETLANASEERILQVLDEIIENGKYTPPDQFMIIPLAEKLVSQYYNLYSQAKLEESKLEMLRNFFNQLEDLKQAAVVPPQMPLQGQPQAVPQAPPQSDMIPNVPQSA
jgi:hypothetical protein